MRKIFLAFVFVPLVQAVLLQTNGASASDFDWKTTICPANTLTGTTTNVPYQYLEILDNTTGLFKMNYNMSEGSQPARVSTFIRQTSNYGEDFRLDGYQDLTIDITLNLTQVKASSYLSFFYIDFWYRQSKTIKFEVYYWVGPTASCSSPKVNISGVQYGYTKIHDQLHALQACSPSPPHFQIKFDLKEVGLFAVSKGLLRIWDVRKIVTIYTLIEGSGELLFVQKAYYSERFQYLWGGQRKLNDGFFVFNEPNDGDFMQNSFVNLSLPSNGSVKGIISDYFEGNTSLSGSNGIIVGVRNGVWKTPNGSYGLPVIMSSNTSLLVNVSLTAQVTVPTNICAYFHLSFRDDFNPATLNFTQGNTYYSRKFIINFWSSQLAKSTQSSKLSLSYLGSDWKLDWSEQLTSFTFSIKVNLTQLTNFDLLAFVRYIRDRMALLGSNEYLVGIQLGFLMNKGRSKMTLHDFSIEPAPEPEITSAKIQEKGFIKIEMLSCYKVTNDQAMCEEVAVISSAVSTALAVPAVGVLMRFSPLISLVDEYTFYAYHIGANYDRGLKFTIKMCSDWTNSKWVPSFLENVTDWLDAFMKSIANTTIDAETVRQPNKFHSFEKSNNFFSNVSDFFLVSVPINMAVFLFFMGLCWALRLCSALPSVQSALRPFCSAVFFWSATFADNMTYLSFHCFLQLYRFVPFSRGANALPSCVLCVLTLFALFLTCFLGLIARVTSRNGFEVDHFRSDRLGASVFFGLAIMGKFVSGFFHAYADDPLNRAFGLFAVSSCVFVGLAFCAKALHLKMYVFLYVPIYGCKALLNFQLFLEIWAPNAMAIADDQVTKNALILVVGVFGLMMVIYLANGLEGIFRTAFKQKLFKNKTIKEKILQAVTSKRVHRRTQIKCQAICQDSEVHISGLKINKNQQGKGKGFDEKKRQPRKAVWKMLELIKIKKTKQYQQ